MQLNLVPRCVALAAPFGLTGWALIVLLASSAPVCGQSGSRGSSSRPTITPSRPPTSAGSPRQPTATPRTNRPYRSTSPVPRERGTAATTRPGGRPSISSGVGVYQSADAVPVALNGFCPVSLLDDRQWLRGDSRHRAVFDGHTYLFADRRKVDIFRARPERYAPALGGDCVVQFADLSERVPGNLAYGAVHGGRLYFFSSAEHQAEFTRRAEALQDADVALGGECVVCRVDRQERVAGNPLLVSIHDGMRYFFPHVPQREQFESNPERYQAAIREATFGSSQADSEDRVPPAQLVNQPGSGRRSGSANHGSATAERGSAAKGPTVAMLGFCPVCIHELNKWVRGNPAHRVDLDGKTYLFPGEEQRRMFVANPGKYVPAMGGDCTVCQKEMGKRVAGSVYHAVFHRGRLYFFPGREQMDMFKAAPDKYANVDLAMGGNCPVCKIEMGEDVPGTPDFTTWFRGLRYRFPAEKQREMFLKNPEKYTATSQ